MNKTLLYFCVIFLGIVFVAPYFVPFSPFATSLENSLVSPNFPHIMGTDSNGKDIFSQVLYGTRYSLFIALVVVFICTTLGLIFGFLAGYFSGIVDKVFVFFSDVFQAVPGLLLAISIAAFIEPSLINLILILSVVGWVSYARLVRAQVLELKNRDFILAAKAMGVELPELLFKHFLPNLSGPLVIQASFGIAGVILVESTLSFLGLGLPVHLPSLGKLLDSGVNLLLIAPYVSLFPGLIIMLLILYFNYLGDRLRDKL